MDTVAASEFLASATRKQTIPVWVIVLIGVVAGGLTARIPKSAT